MLTPYDSCHDHECDGCRLCKVGTCCRRDRPGYEFPETGSWLGDIHGQLGVVSYTDDGLVICHICGGPYQRLGLHVPVHGTWAAEYKAYFGLRRGQSLQSLALQSSESARMSRPDQLVRVKAMALPRSGRPGQPRPKHRLQSKLEGRGPNAGRPRKIMMCIVCGDPVPWSWRNKRKTCSDACYSKHNSEVRKGRPFPKRYSAPPRTDKLCVVCGQPVLRRRPTRGIPKTCSEECALVARRTARLQKPVDAG
jgi:predicted nucleic acid-binding Zn ribbon protein